MMVPVSPTYLQPQYKPVRPIGDLAKMTLRDFKDLLSQRPCEGNRSVDEWGVLLHTERTWGLWWHGEHENLNLQKVQWFLMCVAPLSFSGQFRYGADSNEWASLKQQIRDFIVKYFSLLCTPPTMPGGKARVPSCLLDGEVLPYFEGKKERLFWLLDPDWSSVREEDLQTLLKIPLLQCSIIDALRETSLSGFSWRLYSCIDWERRYVLEKVRRSHDVRQMYLDAWKGGCYPEIYTDRCSKKVFRQTLIAQAIGVLEQPFHREFTWQQLRHLDEKEWDKLLSVQKVRELLCPILYQTRDALKSRLNVSQPNLTITGVYLEGVDCANQRITNYAEERDRVIAIIKRLEGPYPSRSEKTVRLINKIDYFKREIAKFTPQVESLQRIKAEVEKELREASEAKKLIASSFSERQAECRNLIAREQELTRQVNELHQRLAANNHNLRIAQNQMDAFLEQQRRLDAYLKETSISSPQPIHAPGATPPSSPAKD